jgi:hypothetical protein
VGAAPAAGVETEFAVFLRGRGFPPPSFNVLVADKLVDAYWPEYGLIVERETRTWHGTWEARERDLVRQEELMRLDLRVPPATTRRLREAPGELERTLRRLMATARPLAAPAAAG